MLDCLYKMAMSNQPRTTRWKRTTTRPLPF